MHPRIVNVNALFLLAFCGNLIFLQSASAQSPCTVTASGTTTVNSLNFFTANYPPTAYMPPNYSENKIYDFVVNPVNNLMVTVGKYRGQPSSASMTFPVETGWRDGFLWIGSATDANSQLFAHHYVNAQPREVALDTSRDYIIGGEFLPAAGPVELGLLGSSHITTATGGVNVFITQLKPVPGSNFAYQYTLELKGQPGGNNGASLVDMETDGTDNIIVALQLYGIVDLDPGRATKWVGTAGNPTAVIASYTSAGNLAWFYVIPPGPGGIVILTDMDTDPLDPAYNKLIAVAGRASGNNFLMTLDGNTGTVISNDTIPTGSFYGSLLIAPGAIIQGIDLSFGIIMVTGKFEGTVDFDLSPVVYSATSVTGGGEDSFTALYFVAGLMPGGSQPILYWVDTDNSLIYQDSAHVQLNSCAEIVSIVESYPSPSSPSMNVNVRVLNFSGSLISDTAFSAPVEPRGSGGPYSDPASAFWAENGQFVLSLSNSYTATAPMFISQGSF